MTNRKIDLDRNLFALAFSVVRCNWLPCGAAVLLLLASHFGAGYLHAPLAFATMRASILVIVGYAAYRVLLTGGEVAGWRAAATAEGRVPWRFMCVMLMILTPILILGIVWTAPGAGFGPTSLPRVVLGVVMVVAYASAYVLLGTALPEIAERGEVAMSEAIARGRSNYRVIAKAMVFGPWVFRAGIMAAMILAVWIGGMVDLFNGQTGVFQPAGLWQMVLRTSSDVFAEVLTAIVLVRAYRRYPAAPRDTVAA